MESIIVWLGIFVCLSQSAILSGLDLACFAVSRVQLEIGSSESNPDAIKVLELRKDSNFLLATILWGNMGSNTLLALLSGSVLGGVAAFLFSTIFLTVFAEIIPQAYFSRNALRIAAVLSPIVKVYQFVLYPVAKPSAKVLDLWLGSEGVHYLREKMLRQYILKNMEAEESDINPFEGRGAVNFLALDSRRVGEEGQPVEPSSVVSLPVVNGHLDIPRQGSSRWTEFLQQVQRSSKKWVILADTQGEPRALLNAQAFLGALYFAKDLDPGSYCVRPIVTHDPRLTLEEIFSSANLADEDSPEKGIILLWGTTEKRIIAHADVLKRLFEGVFASKAGDEALPASL
jgi:hypothetical protein